MLNAAARGSVQKKPFWLPTLVDFVLQNERVLFHYNGHGVPRPTMNGEIWVFNKSYTQYIPMSIYDLQAWLGTPCIFVFDCSAAGLIVNSFKAFAEQKPQVGTCCIAVSVLALYYKVAKLASALALYSMACLSPNMHACCNFNIWQQTSWNVTCLCMLALSLLKGASAGCASPSLNSITTQSSPCQACVA